MNIVEHSIWKKRKKEQTFLVNRHYIDWEKRSKENWTFLNCDCNIVLTYCKVKIFEFKGDIRNFFFLFILWNLMKTIYRRFTNICNYIDSKKFFFRIWGFRGIGNIFFFFFFFFGFCFEESVADVKVRQTFIQLVSDCWWVDGKESNSIEEFAGPWSCSIFLVWSSENGIKEKRRGLLQNFVDNVWVFQSRWCFGFIYDLAKWNESGKGEVPIYW